MKWINRIVFWFRYTFPTKYYEVCYKCRGSGIRGLEPVDELNECEYCNGRGILYYKLKYGLEHKNSVPKKIDVRDLTDAPRRTK